MPDDNLFYGLPCDAYGEPLPSYHVLDNVYLPDPPEPIFDCLTPVPPASPPEPPCPTIGPASAVAISGFADSTAPIATTLTITKDDCCGFTIDVTTQVPCIAISPDSQTYTLPFTDGPSKISATITPVERTIDPEYASDASDNCAFEVYVTGQDHCPTLSPAYESRPLPFTSEEEGELRVTIYRDDDNCDFVIDVTGTAPCPAIGAGSPTLTGVPFTSGASSIAVTVTKAEGDTCSFTVTPDAAIHCPTFTSKLTLSEGAIGSTPTGSLSITGDASCNFAASLSLTVPGSCDPAISSEDGDVTYVEAGKSGYVSVSVAPDGECAFLIRVDVAIPRGAGVGGGGAGGGFGSGTGSGSGGNCQGIRPSDFFRCVNGKTEIRPGTICVNGDGIFFVDDPVEEQTPQD